MIYFEKLTYWVFTGRNIFKVVNKTNLLICSEIKDQYRHACPLSISNITIVLFIFNHLKGYRLNSMRFQYLLMLLYYFITDTNSYSYWAVRLITDSLNTVQTVLHLEVLYLIIDSLNTVQIALHLEVLYLIIDSLNTVQTVLHLEVLYLITDSLNTVQTVLHLEFLFRLLTA